MRKREARVVVTFHTTAEAMATERMCAARALAGRLISAPRQLSADCGIAWSGASETREALQAALDAEKIEYAGIYEMEL